MSEKSVGALLVVKEDELVGIISERDYYVSNVIFKGFLSVNTKSDEVMSSPVMTVDTHKSFETYIKIMADSRLRHLPMVKDGKLLGLLSIGDLIKKPLLNRLT